MRRTRQGSPALISTTGPSAGGAHARSQRPCTSPGIPAPPATGHCPPRRSRLRSRPKCHMLPQAMRREWVGGLCLTLLRGLGADARRPPDRVAAGPGRLDQGVAEFRPRVAQGPDDAQREPPCRGSGAGLCAAAQLHSAARPPLRRRRLSPLRRDASAPLRGAILAVGDFFTSGEEVEDDDAWPAHLQQLLERRVLNAGVKRLRLRPYRRLARLEQIVAGQAGHRRSSSASSPTTCGAPRCAASGAPRSPISTSKNGALVLHNVPRPAAARPRSRPLGFLAAHARLLLPVRLLDAPTRCALHAWYGDHVRVAGRPAPARRSPAGWLGRLAELQRRSGARIRVVVQYDPVGLAGCTLCRRAATPDPGRAASAAASTASTCSTVSDALAANDGKGKAGDALWPVAHERRRQPADRPADCGGARQRRQLDGRPHRPADRIDPVQPDRARVGLRATHGWDGLTQWPNLVERARDLGWVRPHPSAAPRTIHGSGFVGRPDHTTSDGDQLRRAEPAPHAGPEGRDPGRAADPGDRRFLRPWRRGHRPRDLGRATAAADPPARRQRRDERLRHRPDGAARRVSWCPRRSPPRSSWS